MNSAKDFYTYYSKSSPAPLSWDELPREIKEHWESHWAALQERKERMRGHETD